MSDNKSCPKYCFRSLVIAIVLESIASKTLAKQTCCPTIFAMITEFKTAAPQILVIATARALCVCMNRRACVHVCISACRCVRVRARVCVCAHVCVTLDWETAQTRQNKFSPQLGSNAWAAAQIFRFFFSDHMLCRLLEVSIRKFHETSGALVLPMTIARQGQPSLHQIWAVTHERPRRFFDFLFYIAC